MPNQKPSKPGARTWREVRAEAVTEGRLNEEAVAAHTRRMRAAGYGHDLAERRQAAGLTQAQLAARMRVPASEVASIEHGHPEALQLATLRAYLRALDGGRGPHRRVRD